MKRERDEVVEVDSGGRDDIPPTNQILHDLIEPILMMLLDRPIAILKLIRTNSLLADYSNTKDFFGVWRAMLTQLMKMELGNYMSKVYPFFIVENECFKRHREYRHATLAFTGRDKHSFVSDGKIMMRPSFGFRINSVAYYPVAMGEVDGNYYYYVEYDEYTARVIDLLQRLHRFTLSRDLNSILEDYLGGYKVIRKCTFITCYAKGFLVALSGREQDEKEPPEIFVYPSDMEDILVRIGKFVNKFSFSIDRANQPVQVFSKQPYTLVTTYSPGDDSQYPNLEETLTFLSSKDAQKERVLQPKWKRLDNPNMMDEWGEKLANLYDEPEKTRKLFMGIFDSFMQRRTGTAHEKATEDDTKREKDYGIMKFRCVHCYTMTRKVDPHLELAFCDLVCRKSFLSVQK